jgi:hypothetical protein
MNRTPVSVEKGQVGKTPSDLLFLKCAPRCPCTLDSRQIWR